MQLNSENINEIAAALAKAQSSMETPKKDKKNPHFKNQYASLGSILSASKNALNSNGLSVSQQMGDHGGKPFLITTLMHSSGQWIRSYFPFRLDEKATAQQIGSFLTYSKRYSLCSILGVDADEDDEGELASQPAPQKPQAKLIEKEKALEICEWCKSDPQWWEKTKKAFKVDRVGELLDSQYDNVKASFEHHQSKEGMEL